MQDDLEKEVEKLLRKCQKLSKTMLPNCRFSLQKLPKNRYTLTLIVNKGKAKRHEIPYNEVSYHPLVENATLVGVKYYLLGYKLAGEMVV
jgi:hypothetical protein